MGNCTGKTKQAKENQPHPHSQRPHSAGGDDHHEQPPSKSWSELHKAELRARREEEAKAGVHPPHEHHEVENTTLDEHRPPPIDNPKTYSGVR